jgi:AGCS family alanine or glycine:cation symporter
MRSMLMMIAALWLFVAPARAQEDAPADAAEAAAEPTAFESFDAVFGAWVVGPMATVMFWDMAFWDANLPVGELPVCDDGAACERDGEVLVGFTEGQGYQWRRQWTAPTKGLEVALPEPVTLEFGAVSATFTRTPEGLRGRVAPTTLPLAPCTTIDTCGFNINPSAELGPETDVGHPMGTIVADLSGVEDAALVRVVEDRAPFPVVVVSDGAGGLRVPASTTPARFNLFPVQVGATVLTDDGTAEVVAMTDDEATLAGASRFEPGPLANPNDLQVPLVVAWLVVGALFLTLRMGFINLRAFGHAIMVTTGKYDDPDDPGEISHFKALSSALSATVGLGNIAGVAIAVAVGGPGAIPWMIIAGFLGMSSKFTECTLGQLYRDTDSKGQVLGGPMKYLDRGLAEKGLGPLGKVLAVVFSLMCIGGSLGGGNMFQANQSYAAVAELVPMLADNDWLYGVILVVFVGAVILGGIKRIGAAAGLIVPVMCGVYVMAALYIILSSPDQIGPAFGTMFEGAFSTEAGIGGVLGALIQGFRRAAFSNEAGVGSASIAHSAAATDEPVREGIVALLEPFIDTIVVCTMTGLVVVITGAYLQDTGDGVLMTSAAFGSVISWFPMVLTFAVVMFAFSTMISWSYYGERCATWLFGAGASLPYKVLFLVCTFLGVVFELGTVLDFSDLMILGMAFPNILGLFILSGLVKEKLDDYWGRLKSGEMLPDR